MPIRVEGPRGVRIVTVETRDVGGRTHSGWWVSREAGPELADPVFVWQADAIREAKARVGR